jgi:hypothetical protein
VFLAIPATNERALVVAAALAFGCGVVQLLWVVPLVVAALVAGHKQLVWGLAISAALVFLLNTACWGWIG